MRRIRKYIFLVVCAALLLVCVGYSVFFYSDPLRRSMDRDGFENVVRGIVSNVCDFELVGISTEPFVLEAFSSLEQRHFEFEKYRRVKEKKDTYKSVMNEFSDRYFLTNNSTTIGLRIYGYDNRVCKVELENNLRNSKGGVSEVCLKEIKKQLKDVQFEVIDEERDER